MQVEQSKMDLRLTPNFLMTHYERLIRSGNEPNDLLDLLQNLKKELKCKEIHVQGIIQGQDLRLSTGDLSQMDSDEIWKKTFQSPIMQKTLKESYFYINPKEALWLEVQGFAESRGVEHLLFFPIDFNGELSGFWCLEWNNPVGLSADFLDQMNQLILLTQKTINDQVQKTILSTENNNLKLLMEGSHETVLIVQKDRIINGSEEAVELFACSTLKEAKANLKELFGEKDTKRLDNILNDEVLELDLSTPNKGMIKLEVRKKEVELDGENYDIYSFRDISSYKKIEEELRASELRWHFSVDGSELGLWDWNVVTNEVFFSKQWKNILGFKDHEIYGSLEEWDRRVHPADKEHCYADINAHFEGKTPHYINEHRVLCKDGSYKWILDRGKVVEWTADGKPQRMIGTHYDVTEKRNYLMQLEELNKTKDKLFSIISHDLRGPVWGLVQLCEWITLDQFNDEKERIKTFQSFKELTLSAYDLLENLLQWARVNQNEISYSPKSITLNEVIDEVLTQNSFNISKKNITITKSFDAKNKVYTDENMTHLIVRNIIGNAIKFTPENGLINIRIFDDGKFVGMSVKDTGIGMGPDLLNKVMNGESYDSSWGTNNEKGTGLGLSLCRDFVKKCKGRFSIQSEVGLGSEIEVVLPSR